MYRIHKSRINKTLAFISDPGNYTLALCKELRNLKARAAKKGYRPIARLNGTSDIVWENILFSMETEFKEIIFYDYTKSATRMYRFLNGKLPKNYHLTYSYNEYSKPEDVACFLQEGGNVAVVFRDEIPGTWMGYPVINGDDHDFRFLDHGGRVIGLKAKGRARHDTTGFVVDA